ncbi:uracil DNA glycosylase superfamily protein [bacterium BMS3Abin01]|nr:uracil DNA glycosylase superfamily protein [bacterium BMS3Abin01]
MVEVGDSQTSLEELRAEVEQCRRCALSRDRTNIVFGSGSADALIMFVGEAPGYHEDQQGQPFVGQAGKLLEKLLGRIGLTRDDVYIANVLKCRPPGNRDPLLEEIDECRVYLERQVAIIEPLVICTLGNFSTKLLSGRPDGITRVHGTPQPLPGSGGRISLFPVLHPAAALYTAANLKILEEDFDHLPQLLDGKAVEPLPGAAVDQPQQQPAPETPSEPEQLDLF